MGPRTVSASGIRPGCAIGPDGGRCWTVRGLRPCSLPAQGRVPRVILGRMWPAFPVALLRQTRQGIDCQELNEGDSGSSPPSTGRSRDRDRDRHGLGPAFRYPRRHVRSGPAPLPAPDASVPRRYSARPAPRFISAFDWISHPHAPSCRSINDRALSSGWKADVLIGGNFGERFGDCEGRQTAGDGGEAPPQPRRTGEHCRR